MRDLLPPPPAVVVRTLQPIAQRYHLLTLPWHAHEIVAAFTIYLAIFAILSPICSEILVPNLYRNLSGKTQVNWNIRVVSTIQSISICGIALYVISSDLERYRMGWEDRIWGYTGAGGMVQAFAAGYFLWDVLVSAMYLQILGIGSLLHAICALLITCLGFHPFANYYGLNFILYELSTPMLNVHWFLDKLNMTGSTLQLVNGILLMAAFFGCRCVWGSYQSVRVYGDVWMALKKSTFAEDPQSFSNLDVFVPDASGSVVSPSGRTLPMGITILYLVSNTVLVILNFYWFGKMIEALQKRFKPAASGTKKQD